MSAELTEEEKFHQSGSLNTRLVRWPQSKTLGPKSALCLIPPSEVVAQIQAIRAVHDKQFYRWPPHINLLYPFYLDTGNGEVFDDCAKKISESFASRPQPAVPVSLDHSCFDFFTHKGHSTLLFKPKEEATSILTKLFNQLQSLFPDTGDSRFTEFQPHLSLGQFDTKRVDEFKKKFATEWESKVISFDWNIDRVYLMSRANAEDPFHVRKTVLFDGTVL